MDDVLINIANKLDAEGKHDLADAVDTVIKTGARPKAPLKQLDDDVKKDLLKLLSKVKKSMGDSSLDLKELFARLRYFDIGDVIKELGLDKAMQDMSKMHSCMDGATRTMYALTHGKKPSKADMEQMSEDFGFGDVEKVSPLDFFVEQSGMFSEEPEDESEEDENVDENVDESVDEPEEYEDEYEDDEDEDISDEEIESFWSDDYNLYNDDEG